MCIRDRQGSDLLVAMGRTPNTEGIGLELAGVELTDRGYIKVNERLETTAEGVWANGEVAGSPQFTHIAFDDFRILRENLNGGNRVTTGRQVPFSMFTDPELAHAGLSETEAKARGASYRLFKIPMSSVLRTRTLSEMRGFMKALVGEDGRILGFRVFGAVSYTHLDVYKRQQRVRALPLRSHGFPRVWRNQLRSSTGRRELRRWMVL